jgi:RNA polymerase sigma-70 factor (ECF subfamily)
MSATTLGAAVQSPPFTFSFSGVIDYIAPLFSERENLDEQLLAERLKRRDEQALSDAYALYSRPVFSFLSRLTGDRNTAEDVQQQVFLEVWQKASNFDPSRGSMLGWIMTIARSRALDSHRKRVPEPRDLTAGAEANHEPATEDEIDAILGEWHFEQLLAQLPEEESELLKHRFHGGLSQSEISRRTGIPLGTVKSRMVSALDRLRMRMEVEA